MLTEEQFLARCKNAYQLGLADPSMLKLLENWVDFVLRFDHTMFSAGQTQGMYLFDFMDRERQRLTDGKTLANDKLGYQIIRLAAILGHPCQACAEDPNAWHTRSAFCDHQKKGGS